MKKDQIQFQDIAIAKLRAETYEALGSYKRTHTPQVVSYTAPTGAGKTIIIASLMESVYFGNENYPEQPEAIFVWLSDSPELNEQSKQKIDLKADKIRLNQTVTIDETSFNIEYFEDGHIYFLNTQKIGSGKLLTKHSDGRQYTIWETIRNTVQEKSDRLYFIIDEAHRGMQGREASKATSIMQKFIKGSEEDGIPAMPLVIGITATWDRFNALVSGTTATLHRIQTTADEVRSSGLLKDRIVITYPDTINNDMALLQAAADEWKQKWDHWTQYCYEQHYAYVNPIFIIQVQNGNARTISETDLDDCLQKIEERIGMKFQSGEVVHTFGQTSSNIQINGLDVQYVEPSKIAEDRNIKIVFFKENLSTGWDCPRAETMMSFRHANDSTYIAQLLGRMIRTPLQRRIKVDDTLNDVHLYLPYFNVDTVNDVVEALQNSEGGDIPTDVYGESFREKTFDTLTVRTSQSRSTRQTSTNRNILGKQETEIPGQTLLLNTLLSKEISDKVEYKSEENLKEQEVQVQPKEAEDIHSSLETCDQQGVSGSVNATDVQEENKDIDIGFDREEIVKEINDAGLLTYNVRSIAISNYMTSLYALARLLVQSGIELTAKDIILDEIVEMIHQYVQSLKQSGKYDKLFEKVMQFKLNTQIFDVFGETIDNNNIHDFLSSTDTDIDRQFRVAESKLGNEGVCNRYGTKYSDVDNMIGYKIDVILFVSDDECLSKLNSYAKSRFHQMNDYYRRKTIGLSEKFRNQYDRIVSDGDIVSKHNYVLPESIQVRHEKDGKDYTDHLFVEADSGKARIKLNGWEEGVLAEEHIQKDFVCWIRNLVKASWSLCIPYEINGVNKPTYPDFIVIRKDNCSGYIIDILEPHDPSRADNLGKAKGFAEYARQNPGVGRIQLIRKEKDGAGNERFKRLDMSKGIIRDKVKNAINNDELDHIFSTDGEFLKPKYEKAII